LLCAFQLDKRTFQRYSCDGFDKRKVSYWYMQLMSGGGHLKILISCELLVLLLLLLVLLPL